MEENKGNRQGYKIEGPVEDLVYKKGYIGKTRAVEYKDNSDSDSDSDSSYYKTERKVKVT